MGKTTLLFSFKRSWKIKMEFTKEFHQEKIKLFKKAKIKYFCKYFFTLRIRRAFRMYVVFSNWVKQHEKWIHDLETLNMPSKIILGAGEFTYHSSIDNIPVNSDLKVLDPLEALGLEEEKNV